MSIIIFDVETTGLLAPGAASVEYQPHLVELYAIELSDDLMILDTLWFRCKPPIDIPEEAIKVHGITNEEIKDALPFVHYLLPLSEFFLGARVVVGHNLLYDKMVLYYELMRLGKVTSFPWPPINICTAECIMQQLGYRLNLTDLHMKLFAEIFTDAHSASVDCRITAKCFVEMVKKEWIVL